jgi:hypothetical protein
MGEEESHLILLCVCDGRCTATLVSRLGVVVRLVAGAVAVEVGSVVIRLALATGSSCLLSLPAAVMISLRLPLIAVVRTPVALLGCAR